MTSTQLRDLFFRTGLPSAYCLSQVQARREARGETRRESHAADHPGDRPAGDKLQGSG